MTVSRRDFINAALNAGALGAAGSLLGPSGYAQTDALAPAVATAESLPRMRSLLVSQASELLLERYFNGASPEAIANVKSVSKSIISALVGIAIDRGHLQGVAEPIAPYFDAGLFAGPSASKADITIEDLLTMRAGLETTSNRNYGAWVLSANWIDFALEQPMLTTPGTRMQYSTGNTHLLSAILTRATGRSTLEFARANLGAPLGFHLAAWPRDPQGLYFGGNDMEMTPRQMLAFGELYRNQGRVGTKQVLPADWVRESFEPRTESPREPGRYYGYGWWIRAMAGLETPYAWGFGGQFVVIVPELELVVVTTSSSNPGNDRRRHTRAMYNLVEHDVIARLRTRT